MNVGGATQYGQVVWLIGLSRWGNDSGKGTLCAPSRSGQRVDQLDGDDIYRDLSSDLDFSPADRETVEESPKKIPAYVVPLLPLADLTGHGD